MPVDYRTLSHRRHKETVKVVLGNLGQNVMDAFVGGIVYVRHCSETEQR